MNTREIIKKLKEAGWQEMKGRGKGSHCCLTKDGEMVTIPLQKDMKIGTLIAIEKKTGVKLR